MKCKEVKLEVQRREKEWATAHFWFSVARENSGSLSRQRSSRVNHDRKFLVGIAGRGLRARQRARPAHYKLDRAQNRLDMGPVTTKITRARWALWRPARATVLTGQTHRARNSAHYRCATRAVMHTTGPRELSRAQARGDRPTSFALSRQRFLYHDRVDH